MKRPIYCEISLLILQRPTLNYFISVRQPDRGALPSNVLTYLLDFDGILPSLWSIDGATPAPPIIKEFWIPFMSSSTVLVHANLLRAAIWRAGNRAKSSPICAHDLANPARWLDAKDSLEILTLKSKSISLLNARLRTPGGKSVDDEAIASVIFFFYNEVSDRSS
jgi:hypothetical protein